MSRKQIPKRYFLYRADRLKWNLKKPPSGEGLIVVEEGKSFWSVKPGDSLVFTEERGLEQRFAAVSTVRDVRASKEGDINIVSATVDAPVPLPEGLTFGRFMYSLVVVSNFRMPWLHMRHRRILPTADVATLQERRIAWDRTVFFGLLEKLPPYWRTLLEHESRARSAAKHLDAELTGRAAAAPEPVAELLELIEGAVLVPARLAADVAGLWQEISDEPARTIRVGGVEDQMDWGDFGTLLATSTRRREVMERHWGAVVEIPREAFTTTAEVAWRPHRW